MLTYDTGQYEVEEHIEIVSSVSPARPTARRYFLCPGWDDAPCQKRVGKLYLPPGEDYFRCRTCHDLTYRSVKEHDKRIDALLRSPAKLKKMLKSKDPRKVNVALPGSRADHHRHAAGQDAIVKLRARQIPTIWQKRGQDGITLSLCETSSS